MRVIAMTWISDRLDHRPSLADEKRPKTDETLFDAGVIQRWRVLVTEFEHETERFQQIGSAAEFRRLSEYQCRISNSSTKIAAVVTADLAARTIEYSYEPEQKNTAVPERGLISLRTSDESVDLYSADQRLTPEQVCKLILEPLVFPSIPVELRKFGT
jgi:hypothetical protein